MEIPRQVCASCNALGASRRQALRQEQGLRAGCAARAAGTLSRGERTGGPRRPRRGFRTPGPQFTSLARGVNGLICRLIILLPQATPPKRPPTAPAAGIRSAAGVVGWREEQDSSRRSDDLGRVAGRPVEGKRPLLDTTAQRGAAWRHVGHSVGKQCRENYVAPLSCLS